MEVMKPQGIMNIYYDKIQAISKLCGGDMEETKQMYKNLYGRHITDRHIMKALSDQHTKENSALESENLEYIDCVEVKEEYEDEVASFFEDPIAEEASENSNLDCIEPDKKLQYCPIVYTTRLEDMHIFKKNFDDINLESVVKSVVAASKPELTSDSLIKKENLNDFTFYDLVDKLEQFNTLVNQEKLNKKVVPEDNHIDLITNSIKTEAEDSNSDSLEAKIKELCKPLSVALVDCKHLLKLNKLCRKHKMYPFGDVVLSCTKCVKVFRVGDDVKVLKNDPPRDGDAFVQDVNRETNIETSSKYVTAAKTAEIALNRGGNVKGLIKMNDEQITFSLPRSIGSFSYKRGVKLSEKVSSFWVVMKNIYCNTTEIWNVRYDDGTSNEYFCLEHVIKSDKELMLYIPISCSIIEFINCCWLKRCKNNQTYFFGTNKLPYLWSQPHSCPCENCICCCKNNISIESLGTPILKKIIIERSTCNMQHLGIAMANNDTNICINKVFGYCKLPERKAFVSVQYHPELFSRIRIKKLYDDQMIEYIIRLNGLVQSFSKVDQKNVKAYFQLTKSLKVVSCFNDLYCCWVKYDYFLESIALKIPYSLKFLRVPHSCPFEGCKCCCKSKYECAVKKFEPIKLPRVLIHTKRTTTNYKRNVKSLGLATDIVCKCIIIPNVPQEINLPKRKCGRGREPITAVPVSLSKTVVETKAPPTENTAPVTETQDPTVTTLIASILDTFKNIRLKLNPDGKVTAEMDTPATALTNDELKLLSKLLALAQEQVKALGLTYNPEARDLIFNVNIENNPSVSQERKPSVISESAKHVNPQNKSFPSNTTIPSVNTVNSSNQTKNPYSGPFEGLRVNNQTLRRRDIIPEVHQSEHILDEYSKLTLLKNEQYRRSLEAFFEPSNKQPITNELPQIQNTFSLKESLEKPSPENFASPHIRVAFAPHKIYRKRKLPNDNSGASLEGNIKKQVTDIQISNVHSQVTMGNVLDPSQKPPQPSSAAMNQSEMATLTPCNYPSLMGPVFLVNNAAGVPFIPQVLPMNGALVQPVMIPNSLMNNLVPMPNPFQETELKTTVDATDDDCILGV